MEFLLNMYKSLRILFLIVTILISMVFAIYLCEIYLIKIKYIKKPMFLDFTDIGTNEYFLLDSNLIYKLNNDKYRNIIKPKNTSKINIAFIGDSATYSFGASQDATYPVTFENLFNQKNLSKLAQINNFGIPGYGLDQEYFLAKEIVIPYNNPDILIWNINVNDIWDSNFSCLYKINDNHQLVKISGRHNLSYWYGWLKTYLPSFITNSDFFNFLWQQIVDYTTQRIGEDRFTFGCSSSKLTLEVQNQIIRKLNFFINDLNRELKKTDSKLIITIIPYQQYFDNRFYLEGVNDNYLLLKNYLKKQPFNYIDFNEVILKQLDFSFYQQFRNHTSLEHSDINIYKLKPNLSQEYFLDGIIDSAPDTMRHPNQKMYNLMAETLNGYLEKIKLTP